MAKKKIFISYSHFDSTAVFGIARYLDRNNYDIWIDSKQIQIGSKWADTIDCAIEGCDCFLCLLTKSSISRTEVIRETLLAINRKEKDPNFHLVFIVSGHIHYDWFVKYYELGGTEKLINYIKDHQVVKLSAFKDITLKFVENLTNAIEGKAVLSNVDIEDEPDVFDISFPTEAIDKFGTHYYQVHPNDLTPSASYCVGLDNAWIPNSVWYDDPKKKELFLQKGFSCPEMISIADLFQKRNFFLSLIHSRQVVVNKPSIISCSCFTYYYNESTPKIERDAFEDSLKDGSIIVYLYEANESTPLVGHDIVRYKYDDELGEKWNALCKNVPVYCIRANWVTLVDSHAIDLAKFCITLACDNEQTEMIARSLNISDEYISDFSKAVKNVALTVFNQTHVEMAGGEVKGYKRSLFYKDFIVSPREEFPGMNPIFYVYIDEKKPYYYQLKKIADVFYDTYFANTLGINPIFPYDERPSDAYIDQLFIKHGNKDVGVEELEYAFTNFFLDIDELFDKIDDVAPYYFIDNWNLSDITKFRKKRRWYKYIETLEDIYTRSSTWEVDFDRITTLVENLFSSLKAVNLKSVSEINSFVPTISFRIIVGGKALDVINIRDGKTEKKIIKRYPGSFRKLNLNPVSIRFKIGDISNNDDGTIFLPVLLFDGLTDYQGVEEYYNELVEFFTKQLGFTEEKL